LAFDKKKKKMAPHHPLPYISSSGGITIMIGMVYKETTKSHEKAIVFLIKVDSDRSSSSSSEEKKMERKKKEKP